MIASWESSYLTDKEKSTTDGANKIKISNGPEQLILKGRLISGVVKDISLKK